VSAFTAAGYFVTSVVKTSVSDQDGLPGLIGLEQNFPNPFNPTTMIRYRLNAGSHVSLTVHNVLGAEVAVLVDEEISSGEHAVSFDGASLASGTYFYTLRAGSIIESRRMLLVR
jgi:glucuronoarabinoxylan endo-1,4-beta-xylanase